MRTPFRPIVGALIAAVLVAAAVAAEPMLRIGTNFTGSTLGVDSPFYPPDTVGAVGRRHIVELLNGHYAVYLKKDGTRVRSTGLGVFWNEAGAPVRGAITDPRVLFDPFGKRWYASAFSINFGNGPDDLLFAVSKSEDPTQGWAGFTVPFAGPVGITFIDFPTLGFDRDGVFVFTNGAVLVLPKSDLLASPPTIARSTLLASRDLLTPSGTKLQPIVSLDNTALPQALLGPWDPDGTTFRRWNILAPITAPVLDATIGLIAVTPYQSLGNQGARQPDTDVTLFTGAGSPTFAASVVVRNGVMWGVQSVANEGRSALRWFAIDALTNVVLQEGLIADPVKDIFMGSIAVNVCNDVVIGFNASSPAQYASAYAVAGTTAHYATTFGEPLLLKAGVASFALTGGSTTARWGDYSATVVDPRHPFTFWTLQEWPSALGVWSTQITELKLRKHGRHRDPDADDRRAGDGDGADAPFDPKQCH
jgi:hypothetical protein